MSQYFFLSWKVLRTVVKKVWVSPLLERKEEKPIGFRTKKKLVSSYLRVLRELVVATHDGSWSRGGGGDVVVVVVVVASPRSVSRHGTRRETRRESVVSTKLEMCCGLLLWCPLPSSVRDIEYTRARCSMNAPLLLAFFFLFFFANRATHKRAPPTRKRFDNHAQR